MTERALALGVDRAIVDTSGLVQGERGRLVIIKRALVVETPVPEHAIAGVRLGRHRIH
jgi:hypothetical protein